jgi:chromatin structure-remodeling complex subunit RSC58
LAELESIKQEKEAIKRSSRDFANVITSTLLRLNKLRQERYYQSSNSSIIPPTQTEVRLYNKATKLIILFIEVHNVDASDLAIQFSKKLPVLVADYSGTLPGMLAIRAPALTGKSTRLPSIRGPYKKKNKLQ